MKEPLALWRNKDPLTLFEAAALLCECEPGLTYDHRNSEERRERDRIKTARARLVNDIEAGTLTAQAVYGERAAKRGTDWVTREPTDSPAARWLDTERTTITRADLRAWCEANGLRPSVLFPDADKPLGTSERENLLRLIGVLCELAGIDLRTGTKGHAEARRIAIAMEKRNVKIGKETVAKNIAAARNLIAPKGPEELPSDSN